MYELFTDRARKSMQYANQTAHEYNLREISPVMICIGVLKAWLPGNPHKEALYCALEKLGLDQEGLIADFRKQLGERSGKAETTHLRLDPAGQQVIADATRSATSTNEFVDNKHLFLTLVRCEDNRRLQTFFTEHKITLESITSALTAQGRSVS